MDFFIKNIIIKKISNTEVYISLGSNLNRPKTNLLTALEYLKKNWRQKALSSCYITAPIGKINQQPFINAVAYGIYKENIWTLLTNLLAIEAKLERQRIERWGPRTIDLDLLLFGQTLINKPKLQIPHPRLHKRAFVLIPLKELAPQLIIPGLNKSVNEILTQMTPKKLKNQKVEKILWG